MIFNRYGYTQRFERVKWWKNLMGFTILIGEKICYFVLNWKSLLHTILTENTWDIDFSIEIGIVWEAFAVHNWAQHTNVRFVKPLIVVWQPFYFLIALPNWILWKKNIPERKNKLLLCFKNEFLEWWKWKKKTWKKKQRNKIHKTKRKNGRNKKTHGTMISMSRALLWLLSILYTHE